MKETVNKRNVRQVGAVPKAVMYNRVCPGCEPVEAQATDTATREPQPQPQLVRNNEDPKLKRAVLYLHAAQSSNPSAADKQRSAIALQRQVCQRRADELGVEVVHEYADCGVSGRMSERQYELGQLLEDAKAGTHGHIDYVITFDHARIARDAIVYTQVVWELERVGVELQIASIPIADQETCGSLVSFMTGIGRRQVEGGQRISRKTEDCDNTSNTPDEETREGGQESKGEEDKEVTE